MLVVKRNSRQRSQSESVRQSGNGRKWAELDLFSPVMIRNYCCVRWARRGSPCAGSPWRGSAGPTPWARRSAGSSTRPSATRGINQCSFGQLVFKILQLQRSYCDLLAQFKYFGWFWWDLMGWLIELWDLHPTSGSWHLWNISDITRWRWRRTDRCARWSPRLNVTRHQPRVNIPMIYLFMGPVNYVLRKWIQF